jgi:glycosyltransferase involved in cell wall biosynthesis
VVREALASGRPVVAERAGGAPEVLHQLQLGRLAQPGDASAFADAIAAELDAPAVEPASRVALASVPSWSDSASRLHAVLEEAIAEGRRRVRGLA